MPRVRDGENGSEAAGALYALDTETPLEQDETFGEDGLANYRLWNNGMTGEDVYLMRNASQLYRRTGLNYVSDVLSGTMEDGGVYPIGIFTALNKDAFNHPVIPIGSGGSLDFSTGTFTLPETADFELYLHEVSGKWLTEQFAGGMLQMYVADREAVNDFALGGAGSLPEGKAAAEGLTEAGESEGRKYFWLGGTPETMEDPDAWFTVIFWNEENDEADAGRITPNMLKAGESPVDVSLYLFRDSEADRQGEEKYNVLFFDTPEGRKSLVKVVNNVPDGRAETPGTLRIMLRGRKIGGADLPVYSLADFHFAMNDGTDGEVRMLSGFYTATFDGDVFESGYTRIEGIRNGGLKVTLKKDQPVWPERIDGESDF